MSRNGSHNIGSHVLSALSHNVGTMPDDRVLYQYLQQRMDYTATVTTDFPNWIAPTRFVGNLMKTFFSQRHLLEHISESEGLGAYNFQGRNVATRQTGKIKIHLRKFGEIKNNVATAQQESRKSENSQNSEEIWKKAYRTNVPEGWGWIEFTDYTEKKPVDKIISLLKDDVTVAIPGGVVGQHAFYTIVENIIRNAAKHEWASDSRPVGIDNLDIYIDFIDRKEKAEVEFTIWNACGQLPPPTGDDNKFELCDQLNDKLHQQLITEKGDLRRENWGLAEMKISAGYLQRRSIAEIGGLNDSQDNKRTVKTPIITPVAVPDDNGKYHLGYRFAIPESKKILIVIDQGEKVPDLTAEGIYFKTSKDIEDTEKNADGNIELAYEYVVLPKFTENVEKKWLLPFRVLINQEKLDEANNLTISGKEKAAFKFFSGIDYDKLISMTDPVKIKKAVCEAWIAGLKEKCLEGDKLQETIYLQIQANAGAGGGKALVSDRDLYRLVFRECAHSVLMEASRNQNGKTAQVLTALLALTPMNLMSPLPPDDGVDSGSYIRERLVDFCDRFKRELSLSNAFMKVMRKIYHAPQTHPSDTADRGESPNSFELAFLRNVRLDLTSGSDFVKSRVKSLLRYLAETDRDKLGAALDAFCGKTDAMSPHAPVRDLGDLCDDGDETSMLRRNIELLFGTPDISGEFEKLVEKLNSAYLTSEVFLRKYEENISTLPPFYRESTTESGDAGNIDSPLDKVKRYTDDAKGADGIIARYVRHDNGKGDFYAEALSGSQSYLNALVQFNWTDSELVTRLAENALLRVLIIDERVCNFLKVRPNELAACRKMRIFAVDVDGNNTEFIPQNHRGFVEVKKPTKSEKQDESEKESKKGFGIEADNYDILIIHQGIIDKWIDAHDDKKVKPLLDAFKKVVPYVVVTTGRGRPDNIPDDARVLPFSTIESTLFRKYPEKLVLVNTVMNILPAKNVEN